VSGLRLVEKERVWFEGDFFMRWIQRKIQLNARRRGFHVITEEILAALPELREFKVGMLHLFIQHTSASVTINENVSPDVRHDLERHLHEIVPEDAPYYEHTLEGADDMPAHIKASLLGSHLQIPVGQGRLLLGTWQGIYLGEHRNAGGTRTLIATLWGEAS
jgi:secondary thiamine-phosphate synthase enzyme